MSTELVEHLDEAFARIIEVSHDVWLLRHVSGELWKVQLNIDSFTWDDIWGYYVIDYPLVQEMVRHRTSENVGTSEVERSGILFLSQFYNINVPWPMLFENITGDVIRRAANCQTQSSSANNAGSLESSPVFLALRCAALSHDIRNVAMRLPSDYFKGMSTMRSQGPGTGQFVRLCEANNKNSSGNRTDIVPRIDIWRIDNAANIPRNRKAREQTLPYLLKKCLVAAEKMLLSGEPRHWPTVLYTLSMLTIVLESLKGGQEISDDCYAARRQLKAALGSLATLFLHCCDGMHPLVDELDLDWFSLMVGGDEAVVNQYSDLHDMWLEHGLYLYYRLGRATDGKTFVKRLQGALMGLN